MNGVRRTFSLFLLLFLVGCDAQPKQAGETPHQRADREAAAFFAGPVQDFEVTVTPNFTEQLRREPRTYVPARVRIGTNVFEGVGIHVKGSRGSTRSFDDRPALTLNFDKFNPDQECHGLEKLHLNNSVQDESLLSESLASRLYLRAGVPTARATHALLRLNGRDLGLYVLKEGYDARFVRRNFPSTNAPGNLYDGGFLRDVDQDLNREAGKGPTNFSDLHRLIDAAEAPSTNRLARLEATLDVDRFLTFLAVQALTDDWDGYGRNRNNYRLYFGPDGGRAVFIPHGMDQLFSNVGSGVHPGWNGLVAARALELPELRTRYRERLVQLSTNLFTAAVLTNDLREVVSRLDAAISDRPPEFRKSLQHEQHDFQARVLGRIENVQRQLGTLPKPAPIKSAPAATPLAAVGKPAGPPATLTGWQPKSQEGSPTLEVVKPKRDPEFLRIVAKGNSVGSFRTRQRLPAGRYTFTGRAKTAGVAARPGPPGGGAGIRISGMNRDHQLAGDQNWTQLTFDFELNEEREVEFVAELRADRGEVWFDLASLKLTRR